MIGAFGVKLSWTLWKENSRKKEVKKKNKFTALAEVDGDEYVDNKSVFAETWPREVYRETTRKEWISDGIQKARREAKQKVNRETCVVKKRERESATEGLQG